MAELVASLVSIRVVAFVDPYCLPGEFVSLVWFLISLFDTVPVYHMNLVLISTLFCCHPSLPGYRELLTHTHTHTHLTALCPGLPGWAGTRKLKLIWILLKQEKVSGSGISWAICKSSPHSRHITTPAPHHWVFTGRMLFLPPTRPSLLMVLLNQILTASLLCCVDAAGDDSEVSEYCRHVHSDSVPCSQCRSARHCQWTPAAWYLYCFVTL